MLSKNEIKDIQSLRHKKFREESGLFIAEGPKIVAELLQLIPQLAEKVYAMPDWAEQHFTESGGVPYQKISSAELEKISQLQTPNQVLAVFRQMESVVPAAKDNICLYLDAIQDPGNFGTIIRTADWFGVKDIICSDGCADLYHPKVVQSTMASIARVNVYYDEEMQWLQQQTVPVYAAVLNGPPLYELSKVKEGVLIMGNESKGIRKEAVSLATHRLTIPGKGRAESLNAAVATGIILAHLTGV
jgi:TrmH family RNA methyltransferase